MDCGEKNHAAWAPLIAISAAAAARNCRGRQSCGTAWKVWRPGPAAPVRAGPANRVPRRAGGEIDVEIGMMHLMQAPEHRQGVRQHVLQVDRKVEKQKSERSGEPHRKAGPVE